MGAEEQASYCIFAIYKDEIDPLILQNAFGVVEMLRWTETSLNLAFKSFVDVRPRQLFCLALCRSSLATKVRPWSSTAFAIALFWLVGWAHIATAQENVVIQWNNVAIQTIRYRRPGPTVNARMLAIVHTCIYDAWSAYDRQADATIAGGKLRRPEKERTEENKRTAINFAAYRCLVDLFPEERARYDALMTDFRLDAGDVNLDPTTPSGIGNLAAKSVLDFRHHDGSNQLGDLHPGPYSDYTGYKPINSVERLDNVDHWQPLQTPVPDGGLYGRFLTQRFLTPQWGLITPFALTSGSQFRPKIEPASYVADKNRYVVQAREILQLSADLTDENKVIAEYWADGPSSETPAGHWCLFGQFVSARDRHSLDDDVKMFFALTNAIFDASIAAWDAKRAFDSVRPISAIHFLFASQPVRAWGGRFKGTETIQGQEWQPYQPVVMAMTPAFPEFISGHSTLSAAAAEVLKDFTGNDSFGASYTLERGRSKVEPGLTPHTDTTLSWPTFSAAADQAGISRRYCGIHFADGDLYGRATGRQVGKQVWQRVQQLVNGSADVQGSLPVSR